MGWGELVHKGKVGTKETDLEMIMQAEEDPSRRYRGVL